jgi:hypothetical protein
MKKVNTNDTLKATIDQILKEAGISSEVEALKNQVWMITLAKIEKYQAEAQKYQKKYQCKFEEFKKQLLNQKNEENFAMEDDYLDWKFAEEALKIWKERKEIISNA